MKAVRPGFSRLARARFVAVASALTLLGAGFSLLTKAEPARAAVPDAFGFVLWDGVSVVGSGTSPASTTVVSLSPGRYQVTFTGKAAKGGVTHVTAINPVPHWCQINSFGISGADEVVLLSCYKAGGSPDVSAFSAIFDSSSGPLPTSVGAFGYVDSQASGVLNSQYNSALAGNTVLHSTTGVWTVKFPGLATPGPIDGSLQATAVNQQLPVRCKVAGWSSSSSGQVVQVTCWNAAGAPVDTEFNLTYQYLRSLYGGYAPPKYFGYLWNVPPVGPASTNWNNTVGAGANTVSSSGPGLWLVRFPNLAVPPDDVQVTAAGKGSDFCGMDNPWTHAVPDTIVRNVNCFTNSGAVSTSAGFLISANSQN